MTGTGARPWGGWLPSPATSFRLCLVLVCLVAATVDGYLATVLPWAATVAAVELLSTRVPAWTSPQQLLVAQTGAVCVAAALVLSVPPHVMPLLLVPAFRAGERHGRAAATAVLLTIGVALLTGLVAYPTTQGAFVAAQWWLLAVGIGQLGAWHRRVGLLAHQPDASVVEAREAGRLLGRLHGIARRLPTGLDAPAISQLLLDEVAQVAPADRAAVLVRVGDEDVSPVAVRGVERVPWRDPIRSPGTAHTAWTTADVVHDVRAGDGRRRGSAVLAVPVADRDDELLGLLVLERLGPALFAPEEIRAVRARVQRRTAHLHAALAFTELRHISEVGERERLAREMHDGVAQDLAALGFALDAATRRVAPLDDDAAQALRNARAALNGTLRDLRLSISDLRSTVHPQRGLGAAVASHLQALGTARDVAVTVSLQESAFRLPAHHESALLRLTQDFLADARTRRAVTAVGVELESHAPTARVELRRDGGGGWEPDPQLVGVLRTLGGSIGVEETDGVVTARILLGGDACDPAPAVRAGTDGRATAVEVLT